ATPPPPVRFTDVTGAGGIHFRHVNGARGEKFLPETMGGGVACLDFDSDGDIDLFFVNSMEWPGAAAPGPAAVGALYRNDTPAGSAMRFTDVTAGSGLDVPMYGMGAAAGDYDNDGRVDLLVTAVGGPRLFHNLGGGRFREVTREAGLGGLETEWSTAAAWFDLENDGDLDLFVGNYVRWTPEIDREVNNVLVGVGRAYGRPWNYPGTMPRLFRNEGGGRFADVSARSGLQLRNPATGVPLAKTLAVAPIDLNEDGWMDLVVANDTVRNLVFTNRHDGTFAEVGVESGIAYDAYGQARGAMGIDAARFRNDDTLGIAIGNFANEMNALYVSQGPRERLGFADAAIAEGLGPSSQLLLKFGLFFFDYDLDGRLDVLTVNGHIEEEIGKVQTAVRYRQPAQLFWNAGTGQTFVNVGPEVAGPDLFMPRVGRGSAYADLDGDGDLDVVMTQVNGPAAVMRNNLDRPTGWIRIRLAGTRSNRDAIGAWIYARKGGQTIARQVMPTRSYLSQSELPVTLGWGGGTLESLEVRWPDGRRQSVDIPADGTRLVVQER
ncbi:MAG: CRTAC1 family protein, partial [Verrucomicrobiota bacterium]